MTGREPIELRLLGRFIVLRDGREIPAGEFGGRKVRALLRALATRRGSFVSNDVLTEMLWGTRAPADPAANLQVLVNRARRALGRPELVVTGPGGYALAGGNAVAVDAERFLDGVQRARALAGRAALDAYAATLAGWRGEPLAEDSYADWAAEYRDRLLRGRQAALEEAAQLALSEGDAARAVELATAAAGEQPLREVAVLTLIRALTAAGDPAAALGRYDDYRRALGEELGLDPSAGAQAVQAQLLRAGGLRARRRAVPAHEFARLPFVGRGAELDALAAVASGPEIVVVRGASGAGKSRLLGALARRTPIVLARAFLAERDEPWSLARSLAREILAADAAAAGRLPEPIQAALAWLLPELETGRSGAAPDPESRRALLVEAMIRMLGDAEVPMVVDDLQWADATSLAVVEAVLARLERVGAVLALRPAEAAEREAVAAFVARVETRARTVELGPLEPAAISQLVADAQLAAALDATTDRTPLAVAEVLRALAAEGAIERGAHGVWRPVDPSAVTRVGEVAVEGQRAAIAARADAQPRAAKDLLGLLALLAREAPARLLAAAAARDEAAVLDLLGGLARSGLVGLGERGWATAHDMVGEVVGSRLGADERGRLHARLAAALDTPEADPGELARHWLGGGDAARAAAAYRNAAQRALDDFAEADAITLAEAGLALATAADLRAALQETRALARLRRGDITGARADLREALRLQRSGPVRARLLSRSALLASGADDLVRAAELAELALVEAGDHAGARAGVLEVAAVLDMNLDRPQRAQERAAEALSLYQQLGDANGTARILDGRAMATFLDGQISRGVELLRRAAELFEDAGDLVHVITPRSTAGHGLVFAGDPAAGLTLTRAAHDLATTLGNPEGETYALWHTAEALAALHRNDEAKAAATDALGIASRIGHRGWTATAWRALGIAQQGASDLDAALRSFHNSLDASEHLNLFACWAASRCALVLVALGRPDEAAPFVARARSEGPPLGQFEARLAEAELAFARGDESVAGLARAALRVADDAGMRQHRARLSALAGP